MRAIIRSFGAAVLVPAFLLTAMAGPLEKNPPPDAITPEMAWTQPLFGAGIKGNDNYTEGNIFLTYPLWSTIGKNGTLGGSYLFIEPYSSVGRGGEVASSLGLSWRRLFSDESVSALNKTGRAKFMEEGWFLGGNFFVDMLDTQFHNKFWQLAVGLEAGTRYFEVRGNYYIPVTSRKLAERDVSTRSFSNTTQTAQTSYGDPYATGNSILQPFTSQTFATTTTTTVRTVTELFEKGMGGWDAEASILVPWLDQWVDLKLVGGYFSFDNQPFGPQNFGTGHVHGFKAGVELRPVPAIVLSGYWYEDKRLTGGNWNGGAQLQLPLDKTWKDAFKLRRRHLVEHLSEPVHRQNDAIKVGNSETQSTSTTTAVTRRTVRQRSGSIDIQDDIIFVNNGGAVGNGIQAGNPADTGNGTAENPTFTVQHGANLAGANSTSTGRVWSAYVQAASAAYVESVAVKGSTRFIGSGIGGGITALGGKMFGGTGAQPVLNGGFIADASLHPSIKTFGVQGFNIQNGFLGVGIWTTGVQSFSAVNNTLSNMPITAITARNDIPGTTSNALISGNTISNSGVNIELVAQNLNTLTAVVQGNSLQGSTTGDGISGTAGLAARLNATISGNTIASSFANGVGLSSFDTSSLTASVTGNTIAAPGSNGVYLNSNDSSTFNATVSGNSIVGPGLAGILVEEKNTSGPGMTLTVQGNAISGTNLNAVFAQNFNTGGTLNIPVLSNNTIAATSGSGVTVLNAAPLFGSVTVGEINGNSISGTIANGVLVENDAPGGTVNLASVNGNNIATAGGSGVVVSNSATGGGSVGAGGFTINGNSISGTDTNGILVENVAPGGFVDLAGVNGNNITATGGNGVVVYNSATADSGSVGAGGFTIDNNTILGTIFDGVLVVNVAHGGVVGLGSVNNNTIATAGGNGVVVANSAAVGGQVGSVLTTINGNFISGTAPNGGAGIAGDAVLVQNTGDFGAVGLASINHNVIAATSGGGVVISNSAGSDGIINGSGTGFTIDYNTISGTTTDGVLVENNTSVSGGFVGLGSVSHNIITVASAAGGTGVAVQSTGVSGGGVGGSDVHIDFNTISGTVFAGVNVLNTAPNGGGVNLASVNNNNISAVSGTGVIVDNSASTGGAVGIIGGATINGNTISADLGVLVVNENTTSGGLVLLASVNNNKITITHVFGQGVQVFNEADSGTVGSSATTINGNTINGNVLVGINVGNSGSNGTVGLASVNNNNITTAGAITFGVSVENISSGGSVGNSFTIDGNTISGTNSTGVLVQNNTITGGAIDLASVSNNGITTLGGSGVTVQNLAGAGGSIGGGGGVIINGNTISGTTTDGVLVENKTGVSGGFVRLASVDNNNITTNGGNGVTVQNDGVSGGAVSGVFTIDSNTISGTTSEGVYVFNSAPGGSVSLGEVNLNVIAANGGDGIYLRNNAFSSGLVGGGSVVSGNVITGASLNGIFMQNTNTTAGTTVAYSVTGNSITAAKYGLQLLAAGPGSAINSDVTGNTIMNSGDSGLLLQTLTPLASLNVTAFNGNTITLTGGPATGDHILMVNSGGTLTINSTLDNFVSPVPNTIGGNTVNNAGAATATGTIIINTIPIDVFATPVVP